MLQGLVGKRFNRLTVMTALGVNVRGASIWHCRCECGRDTIVTGSNLVKNITKSCGCLIVEVASQRMRTHPKLKFHEIHGMHRGPEYAAYMNAKFRCKATKGRTYDDYGARGIQFKFTSFQQWYAELGPRPGRGYSVDRINNDGNYEPGNVRWATRQQQQENKGPRRRKRAPVPEEVRQKIATAIKRTLQLKREAGR